METKFWGYGFPFSSTLVFGEISDLARRNSKYRIQIHCLGQVCYLYFCGYVVFKDSTIGIRLRHYRYGYSLLGAYELHTKRLKYWELSRLVFRASWGEEVSSPRVGLTPDYRSSSPRHPHSTLCNILFSVCFAIDYVFQYNHGAHPFSHWTP